MKKVMKIWVFIFVIAIMLLPTMASAATKNFTFSMKHQLGIGTYASTKTSATGTVNMTSWGGR